MGTWLIDKQFALHSWPMESSESEAEEKLAFVDVILPVGLLQALGISSKVVDRVVRHSSRILSVDEAIFTVTGRDACILIKLHEKNVLFIRNIL